jgi:hypothetical protein
MNVQPKLSHDEDPMCRPSQPGQAPFHAGAAHRVPQGPRAFLTWPVEFEVEPWRP